MRPYAERRDLDARHCAEARKVDQATKADPLEPNVVLLLGQAEAGPLLGETAPLVEEAHRKLVAALVRLDAFGLVPAERTVLAIDTVGGLAEFLIELADADGNAEVERRRTTA